MSYIYKHPPIDFCPYQWEKDGDDPRCPFNWKVAILLVGTEPKEDRVLAPLFPLTLHLSIKTKVNKRASAITEIRETGRAPKTAVKQSDSLPNFVLNESFCEVCVSDFPYLSAHFQTENFLSTPTFQNQSTSNTSSSHVGWGYIVSGLHGKNSPWHLVRNKPVFQGLSGVLVSVTFMSDASR